MPKVSLNFEEQLSDSRSNEVAYRLRIDNLGSTTLNLMNLNPQIPDGVELVEVKNSSKVATKERHEKLCKDLTHILNDFLSIDVEEIQSKIIELNRNYIKDLSKNFNSFWRLFLNFPEMQKRQEKCIKEKSSLIFEIKNSIDANIALEKWFNSSEIKAEIMKNLFLAKLEQLKNIESDIGTDASSAEMATIEPDSFYATTYVLKFKRSLFSLKKFSFSVEARFAGKDKEENHLESVATTVAISPKPYILSLITIFSALLGVSLKYSVHPDTPSDLLKFFELLSVRLITGPGISSCILALLLFNILEYTSLGKKIKMGVNWRSALLVGVLCGFFSERMIDALKIMVGGG